MISQRGIMPTHARLLGPLMVWLELELKAEVTEVLDLAVVSQNSPSMVFERWMEVLGSPPCEVGIGLRGVPLHVWRAETFHLLGECLGAVIVVDLLPPGRKIFSLEELKLLGIFSFFFLSSQLPLLFLFFFCSAAFFFFSSFCSILFLL